MTEKKLPDGTYRLRVENIKEGIIYGSFIDQSEKRISASFNDSTGELERYLSERLIKEGQSFNLIVSEDSKKYTLIEVPGGPEGRVIMKLEKSM